MADGRTIVFFPEGAYGPTNNCVGIGNVLRARGHRVVFIVEESFAGNLEAKGFEERLMRLGPPPEEPEIPGQFWIDFIRDTAPVFRKPTIEQLGEFIAPTFQALIDGAKYVQPRLEEILDEVRPDAIVEDNVVSVPGDHDDREPWIRLLWCNPAEVKDPLVPPFSSGYPAGDRSAGRRSSTRCDRTHGAMWATSTRSAGSTGCPPGVGEHGPDFMHESPFLNLYSYPAEADYSALGAAGAHVAPAGLDAPRRRHDLAAARRAREPRRRAHLPQPGQPRARRTSGSCSGWSTSWGGRTTG